MLTTFKLGDHVRWNSDAGRVSGVTVKKITADTNFKGYSHHASLEAPQYFIKSDKTDHIAIHKRHCAAADPCAGKKICNSQGSQEKEQAMTNEQRMQCACSLGKKRSARRWLSSF